MVSKSIPEWQYPLYKESDKAVYRLLERLGKSKKYPGLAGSQSEIDGFLKLLILSQKMKDYRKFRDIALKEFGKNEVNLSKILDESKDIEVQKGIDESWAIFIQDKRLCEFMDKFQDTKIEFKGTNEEIVEFIIRFILSQLLYDWRGPLLAVILQCLKVKKVNVSDLNRLLKMWDHTSIFSN